MATLTVGCKIPQGFWMELVEPGLQDDGKPGIMPAPIDQDKPRALIKGPNSQRIARTNPLTNAFVLTEVDEALATAWFKRNAKTPMVRNGQVFLHAKPGHAAGEAKDRAGIETGFEPLNPLGDPRLKKVAAKAAPDLESMSSETRAKIGAA